jgi:hypothetical protein
MGNKEKTKFDWYVIEYLYPFSYKKFIQKMFPTTGVPANVTLQYFDQKLLYGFFDREGIFLNTEIVGSEAQWMYTLFVNGVTLSYNTSRMSREEIEVDGFQKCFEYLEKKLNEKPL